MLGAKDDVEPHLLSAVQHAEQQHAPREQAQRGGDDGGAHHRALLQLRKQAEQEQAGDEAGIEGKAPAPDSLVPAAGAGAGSLPEAALEVGVRAGLPALREAIEP